MRKRIRNLVIASMLGGLVILLALVVLPGRTPPPAPLPNPNGFDDFLRAAQMVTGKVDDFPDLDREALRALLETNGEVLHVLRLGLTRRCAVPPALWSDSMQDRSLNMLLAAEGAAAGIG